MDNKTTKQHQIHIELDDQTGQGEYSNLTIASHSQAEFILDFIRVLPGVPKSKVKSRVIISPIHAKTFMRALSENIKKFEDKYGDIKTMNKSFSPQLKISKDELPN